MKGNEAARAARDEGMNRAADHADAVHPRWTDMAFEALRTFIATRGHAKLHPFTSEEVRLHADHLGLPEPPSLRAWGNVFQRAARAGMIEKVGVAQSRAAHCHCSFVSEWVSV